MFERRPGFFRQEQGSSAGRRVEGRVKWFNSAKGFGFVTFGDGAPDAFLPMAALRRAGYDDVREGDVIGCETGAGAKGPLVVSVLTVAKAGDDAPPIRRAASGGGAPRTLVGAVKWFMPQKGYGFVAPENGEKDIFVHITVLHRSGIDALGTGQRVRVEVIDGKKGLEADRIALI